MIRAHMATYPARAENLELAVTEISAQVDRLYLTLNEYQDIPTFITENSKIEAVIPDEDLKDVGKFYFKPASNDIVVFVDDDIIYPDNYVSISVKRARRLGLQNNVFGYHCSIYHGRENMSANSRTVYQMTRRHTIFEYVDQIGTGTMISLGKNVPSFDYMQGSQKFVDVRYAKWLHQRGVRSVALKRPRQYLKERFNDNPDDSTIYETFTKNSPQHVIDEIQSFAGKSPLIGQEVKLG